MDTLILHALTTGGRFDGESETFVTAFSSKDHGAEASDDLSPTLRSCDFDGSHANGGGPPAVAVETWALGSHSGAADGDVSNESHASGGPVSMGISEEMAHSLRGGRTQAIASTLVSPGRQWNSAQNLPNLVTAFAPQSGGDMRGITGALPGALHSPQQIAVEQMSTVRRLTPKECERLQGFPDEWTALHANGKPMADGPRYRMLGNAVSVPVAEWIARRIVAYTNGRRHHEEAP